MCLPELRRTDSLHNELRRCTSCEGTSESCCACMDRKLQMIWAVKQLDVESCLLQHGKCACAHTSLKNWVPAQRPRSGEVHSSAQVICFELLVFYTVAPISGSVLLTLRNRFLGVFRCARAEVSSLQSLHLHVILHDTPCKWSAHGKCKLNQLWVHLIFCKFCLKI